MASANALGMQPSSACRLGLIGMGLILQPQRLERWIADFSCVQTRISMKMYEVYDRGIRYVRYQILTQSHVTNTDICCESWKQQAGTTKLELKLQMERRSSKGGRLGCFETLRHDTDMMLPW